MCFTPPILFAAGWETLVAVIIFILWAVGQAMEASKKKKNPAGQKPKAPQPAAPAPAPKRPQQAAAQQPPHDRLREQVDEFLRRAGRKAEDLGPGPNPQRAQPAPGPKPMPVAAQRDMEIEIVLEDDADNPPPRQLVQSTRDAKRAAQRRQKKNPTAPHHETVAEHVAEHVGARTFAERTSHLGEGVIHEDQIIEARIQHKFDRALGSLSRSSDEPAAQALPVDSLATNIAAMLASPAGMQQAIVLGEILQRPEHRW